MNFYKRMKKKGKKPNDGKAVLLFRNVKEGILAEKLLLKNGYSVRKVAPPPEYRKGCEISVEIDLVKKEEITKILAKRGIENQGIVPLS